MSKHGLACINLAKPGNRWTGAERDNDIVVYGRQPTQRILLGGEIGSSNAAITVEGGDATVSGALAATTVTAVSFLTNALNLTLQLTPFESAVVPTPAPWASNLAVKTSNAAFPAWEAATWASNVALGAAIPGFAKATHASNAVALTSNAAFPALLHATWASNVAFGAAEVAAWTSNAAAWTSNVAAWTSNIAASAASSPNALPLSGGALDGELDMGGNAIRNASAIGIGTAAAAYPLHVASVDADNVSMFVAGDILAFSDASVKVDVRRIEGALDKLRRIGGYTFVHGASTVRSAGVLAQEVLEVLPEVVHRDGGSGLLSVAYGNMMALVIEAIKELASSSSLGPPAGATQP